MLRKLVDHGEFEIVLLNLQLLEKLRPLHNRCFRPVQDCFLSFYSYVSNPCFYVYVARKIDTEQMLSFIMLMRCEGECDIICIGTDPGHRRLGIAKALMGFVLKSGVNTVFLEVSMDNEVAVSFYKKLGFQAVGIRKKYYNGSVDAYTMRLDVSRETV